MLDQTDRLQKGSDVTRSYRFYDIISAVFVTTIILSNILSSAKIVDFGITIGPLALAFDAGTLIFPVSYIFGDILTEVYGYRNSRRIIWLGFFSAALTGFFVWLAGVLPGEAEWQSYAGQQAYDDILGGVSGLIVASLTAYWLGEFSNSYVLARMKIMTSGRWLWTRTIGSTIVGQGVDTIAFFLIATALGVFPPSLLITLIVTNYILKVGIEVILTPITLRIIPALKTAENEDFYDYNTRFNPFRVEL